MVIWVNCNFISMEICQKSCQAHPNIKTFMFWSPQSLNRHHEHFSHVHQHGHDYGHGHDVHQ